MKKYEDFELEYWIGLVSKEFYELAYQDKWLKHVFGVVPQEFITAQQTDFMVGLFGGPKRFSGRHATDAHPHIFIDEEMWQAREALLRQAFEKVSCPEDIRERWLKIDEAFKRQIVMADPSECRKRFPSDDLVIVPNPRKRAA